MLVLIKLLLYCSCPKLLLMYHVEAQQSQKRAGHSGQYRGQTQETPCVKGRPVPQDGTTYTTMHGGPGASRSLRGAMN